MNKKNKNKSDKTYTASCTAYSRVFVTNKAKWIRVDSTSSKLISYSNSSEFSIGVSAMFRIIICGQQALYRKTNAVALRFHF